MPTVEKSKRKPSRSRSRSTRLHPTPADPGPDPGPNPSPNPESEARPGRIRKYLPPDDLGRDWSLRTADTPEGRLAGQDDADWYVPLGDEVHLRTDDGRLRLGDSGNGQMDQQDDSGFGSDSDPGSYESGGRGKYRPDDFYIKSTNKHDHTVPWKTSITSELAQTIDAILRSEKFPFRKSREQFTAVALYELVQICLRLEPIPDSDVAVLEAMNQLNRTYQVVVGYDMMIRHKCQTMHDLVERNLKNTARVMLHETLRIIGRMRNRELREKHYKRVRAEFGGLIRESKPVSGRAVRGKRRT